MGLDKKRVLITRGAGQAESFAEMVRKRGGIPILFPTIAIRPTASWDACDRAIHEMKSYDGILFTSANAVDFFFGRLQELSIGSDSIRGIPIYAIGIKTRAAIEAAGLFAEMPADSRTASDLAALLAPTAAGKRFLFPRGNLAREVLVENLQTTGASVVGVVVYETVLPDQSLVDEIQAMFMKGSIDIVTFASPSSVENFLELIGRESFGQFRQNVRLAVIGPTTQAALTQAGYDADIVAPASTIEALVNEMDSRSKR